MASPPPAGGAVSAAAVSVALNAEIEAGDVIGEYHVTGRIGEGGMGTVFAGIHPVIGKKVAIKVLNAALSHDQEIVDRFAQEARRRRCRPRTGSSTGSRAPTVRRCAPSM
jgi:serine/threonine-protein kinase